MSVHAVAELRAAGPRRAADFRTGAAGSATPPGRPTCGLATRQWADLHAAPLLAPPPGAGVPRPETTHPARLKRAAHSLHARPSGRPAQFRTASGSRRVTSGRAHFTPPPGLRRGRRMNSSPRPLREWHSPAWPASAGSRARSGGEQRGDRPAVLGISTFLRAAAAHSRLPFFPFQHRLLVLLPPSFLLRPFLPDHPGPGPHTRSPGPGDSVQHLQRVVKCL